MLLPELLDLDVPALVTAGAYPGTTQLTALNSRLSILALKLYERRRRSHVYDVVHDRALGVFCGLSLLPKRSHLSGYSYRTTRAHNQALLEALVPVQKTCGLIDGESFNLDFHAIMSFGEDQILEEHYVPSRSQRTRSVLTSFAQDAKHATLCYSNADIAKADQAHEIIRFCEFWQRSSGHKPRRLVFDSTLTTHAELVELDDREIGFITLRRRGATLIDQVAKLPQDAWSAVRLERPGKHRDVSVAEMTATIAKREFRQLAVKGLGRDQPTLLLTNQRERSPKQLIERYAKRWAIENKLAAQIRAFHLDALASQVPLAVDLDIGMAVTRTGIPIRVWCWPGNQSEQELIRQVKDDLREWKLSRVVWVADRGFQSAENRRYLQRCGGHYIVGEKLRGESKEAAAALARQGRYRTVAGNLQIKEVVLDDGTMRDRCVICRNPEQAERDKHVRDELIAQLKTQIAGSDKLNVDDRAKLHARLKTKRGLARFLRTTSTGLLRIDRGAVSAEEHLDGKYLLRSSDRRCRQKTSRWATSSCCKSSAAGAT